MTNRYLAPFLLSTILAGACGGDSPPASQPATTAATPAAEGAHAGLEVAGLLLDARIEWARQDRIKSIQLWHFE